MSYHIDEARQRLTHRRRDTCECPPSRLRNREQHEDGHSHLLASAVPNLIAYDPAYAYEIAEIIRSGIERIFLRRIG